MTKCKSCGRLFRQKKEGNQIYCKQCAPKYEKIEYKEVECSNSDCDKKFFVDARNMTKCMCDDCYRKYRRKKKTETMRKLRKKN